MKFTATMTLPLVTMMMQGRGTSQSAQQTVSVCMDGVPGPVASLARMFASQIFARIGVKLDWRHTCLPQGIQITLSETTPRTLRPGALAYALPYEGTHICVFYDRILPMSDRHSVPRILAHVMAHEITHILETTGALGAAR